MHAMHGNTTPAPAKRPRKTPQQLSPHAPRDNLRIAFWRDTSATEGEWLCVTTTVTVDVAASADFPQGLKTSFIAHRDGEEGSFCPIGTWWQPYTAASEVKPTCCACGSHDLSSANRGGTKRGTGPIKQRKGYSDTIYYGCEKCGARCKALHPSFLLRTDPTTPRPTEPYRTEPNMAAPPLPPQGPARPRPPTKQRHAYRAGADGRPCLGDTVLGYANAQGLGTPGAARAFIRDVALVHNDVTAVSEAGLSAAKIETLQHAFEAKGHRVWGAASTLKANQLGTGTLFVTRSTVPARPGEGLIYSKADGKAAAVALMLVDQPVIILAAHLPANDDDDDRVSFLTQLTQGLGQAMETHAQGEHGAPWRRARRLWAGDLNMTLLAEDEEDGKLRPPGPAAIAALLELNRLMNGAIDVYRELQPHGRRYTHGKLGRQRHLDKWHAAPSDLQGTGGVVASMRVSKEVVGFSYVHTGSQQERYKVPDHDMVQAVYRPTTFKAPPVKPSIRSSTLRSHEIRKWVGERLHAMGDTCGGGGAEGEGSGSDAHACEAAFDRLHADLLEVCVRRQRRIAKQNGKKKAKLLGIVQQLRAKLDSLPECGLRQTTASSLERRCHQLQAVGHTARRARDTEEAYEAMLVAEGAGKAARPVTKPTPLTRLDLPSQPGGPVEQHTTQKAVAEASTRYWRDMGARVEPSAEAARDRDEVLAKLKRDTAGRLPKRVLDALTIDEIINPENIKVAINDLAANSTPGADSIPLAFYMSHREEIAPLLQQLYSELLHRGQLSQTMRQAILSPIFKNKGYRHEPKQYRPIAVTTIEYRILSKCIAQRLNKAITFLVGDPQTGFYPGRKYDENILLVRGTVRDINGRRPHDGGLILFLDNEKAFDRVQHDFMFNVLRAFNLPEETVAAVRTLYRSASTAVKTNGEIGTAFEQTSGVRQGCPLSPLLYLLVQEVQLRMIRENADIEGIPIPDHDGRDPSQTAAPTIVKERGLVDDTMVCLRSPESVAPLLHTLTRFEAFSNHRMNVDKTILLLLGQHRAFDLLGDSHAARLLRARKVLPAQVHDVSKTGVNLPDKWHGILLGGEQGAAATWAAAAAQAKHISDSLIAAPLPYTCPGRLAQASGKLMGKVKAALVFTVPHAQKTIDMNLKKVQKAADDLVLGRQHAIAAGEARQPRSSFGIGLLDVKSTMEAAWLQPLLSTLTCAEQRPYKHYMAQAARLGYPGMGAGRELLSLNLSFDRVASLLASDVTGETRQAFLALGALPPFRYLEPEAPEDGSEPVAAPRAAMSAADLRRQLLFFNPILAAEPAPARATREQEEEMLQWARAGITRVEHVLGGTGWVESTDALLARYPALLSLVPCRGSVTLRLQQIAADLRPWRKKLSFQRPLRVKGGEWWAQDDGTLLRAARTAGPGDKTVPAIEYSQQPNTGWMAATSTRRRLPAFRALSGEPCHVRKGAAVAWSDDESCEDSQAEDNGGEGSGKDESDGAPEPPTLLQDTPTHLDGALNAEYRHQLLAPPGQPPINDARLLGWETCRGTTCRSTTCAEAARGRDTRVTFTAQRTVDPRVFAPGERYAGMVEGLTAEERERRISAIAAGINHWAIPSDEKLHLLITAHHGHRQGLNKCKGDKALCAACLQHGRRIEETAQHEHHDCPELAQRVWKAVAAEWLRTTGEELDVSNPLVTVMGVRGLPRAEAETREAAWRLLHSVALLQIHRARGRIHSARHATTPHEPKRVSARHVLQETRRRMQRQIDLLHMQARYAAEKGATRQSGEGAMAEFQRHWITSKAATFSKHGPRLNVFRPTQHTPAPPEGVHVRVTGAVVPATKRLPRAAGYAMTASDVATDGTETHRLRARGQVQSVSAHADGAPAHAPPRVTEQAAQHAAVGEALLYAEQLLQQDTTTRVTVSVASSTTLHHLTTNGGSGGARPGAAGAAPSQAATSGGTLPVTKKQQQLSLRQRMDSHKRPRGGQDEGLDTATDQAESGGGPTAETSGPSAKRQRRESEPRGTKRGRETSTPRKTDGPAHQLQSSKNREKLRALQNTYPGRLRLRAPPEATPTALLRQATSAARMNDARVVTSASGREKSIHQWMELRSWDPGD